MANLRKLKRNLRRQELPLQALRRIVAQIRAQAGAIAMKRMLAVLAAMVGMTLIGGGAFQPGSGLGGGVPGSGLGGGRGSGLGGGGLGGGGIGPTGGAGLGGGAAPRSGGGGGGFARGHRS